MRYVIRLTFSEGAGTPPQRTVQHDTLHAAAQAAQRWLRLINNTSGAFPRVPDRWELYAADAAPGSSLLAYGDIGRNYVAPE